MISFRSFAPVMTNFPLTKIRSEIFGSNRRYTKPGNSSGSYEQEARCSYARPSSRTGKRISVEATIFSILKSENRTFGWLHLATIFATFLHADRASLSLLEPVSMTFPLEYTSAVQRGDLNRRTTAFTFRGLNSAFNARNANDFKSTSALKLNEQITLSI